MLTRYALSLVRDINVLENAVIGILLHPNLLDAVDNPVFSKRIF